MDVRTVVVTTNASGGAEFGLHRTQHGRWAISADSSQTVFTWITGIRDIVAAASAPEGFQAQSSSVRGWLKGCLKAVSSVHVDF